MSKLALYGIVFCQKEVAANRTTLGCSDLSWSLELEPASLPLSLRRDVSEDMACPLLSLRQTLSENQH